MDKTKNVFVLSTCHPAHCESQTAVIYGHATFSFPPLSLPHTHAHTDTHVYLSDSKLVSLCH